MTATAETPTEHDQKEHQISNDQREHPGDGKRAPCNHVVRIVVLRDAALTEARRSRASNERHGLTAEELSLGEALLNKLPAPPPSDPTAKQQKNMFEELKPTDIVVMGVEAASVRVVDKKGKAVPLDASGQPVSRSSAAQRQLFAHDDRNKDTVLRVWTESDTIEYQCKERFEILRVKKAGWEIYDAPDDPFGNSKDGYKARENEKRLWVWTSGLLPASANNQQYKMTFRIGEEEIDPDVVCGNPPPG